MDVRGVRKDHVQVCREKEKKKTSRESWKIIRNDNFDNGGCVIEKSDKGRKMRTLQKQKPWPLTTQSFSSVAEKGKLFERRIRRRHRDQFLHFVFDWGRSGAGGNWQGGRGQRISAHTSDLVGVGNGVDFKGGGLVPVGRSGRLRARRTGIKLPTRLEGGILYFFMWFLPLRHKRLFPFLPSLGPCRRRSDRILGFTQHASRAHIYFFLFSLDFFLSCFLSSVVSCSLHLSSLPFLSTLWLMQCASLSYRSGFGGNWGEQVMSKSADRCKKLNNIPFIPPANSWGFTWVRRPYCSISAEFNYSRNQPT